MQRLQKYSLKSNCDNDQRDRQLRLNSVNLSCINHRILWGKLQLLVKSALLLSTLLSNTVSNHCGTEASGDENIFER